MTVERRKIQDNEEEIQNPTVDDQDDQSDDEEHDGKDSDVETPDHGEFSDGAESPIINPLPPSCFERINEEEENAPENPKSKGDEFSCCLSLENDSQKSSNFLYLSLKKGKKRLLFKN